MAKKKYEPLNREQRLAKAMSHPIRAEMIPMLREGVMSPNRLAKRLGKDVNLVAYHVRVLFNYGCIELVTTEPRRGAMEHFYRATDLSLFGEIDALAGLDQDGRRVVREELVLDEIGQRELEELMEKAPAELAQIGMRAKARLKSPDQGRRIRLEMLHVPLSNVS